MRVGKLTIYKIKILGLLALMFLCTTADVLAQDANLFEYRWFIHSARDTNISNYISDDIQNHSTELRFELIFLSDKIILQGCCGGSFEVDVTYIGEDQLTIGDFTEISVVPCEMSNVTVFYEKIRGVFEGLVGQTVPYNVLNYAHMTGIELFSFSLSNSGNNSFVEISNFPNDMSEESHRGFSNSLPEGHAWSLVKMHYDGEVFELPYGVAYTTFDILNGSLEIALCGYVQGSIKFSWFLDASDEGYFFINCAELENIPDTCEDIVGIDPSYMENFKQNAFSLLEESISPLGEEMFWVFRAYYNQQTFYKLTLVNYPLGELIFYSNEGYLDVNELPISKNISVYPSPAEEFLFVENSTDSHTLSINLYSLQGKLLHAQNIENMVAKIDVSHLDSGIYFLILTDKTGNEYTKRFIKK